MKKLECIRCHMEVDAVINDRYTRGSWQEKFVTWLYSLAGRLGLIEKMYCLRCEYVRNNWNVKN